MRVSFDEGQPIFQQIAEMIEDDILSGAYQEEEQVISTTQIAKAFQINPATAVKGINLLVDTGVLYKKRGLGMFVAQGAKTSIMNKRQEGFYNEFVLKLLDEANKLSLSSEDIIAMIKKGKGGSG
ncbi:GntR family transcriptional regulator [Paenibacillus psychroresistens]|uniref:GntR family transcriptional regulator n=1 Tax=Paenibacillus psychroresistens TaxID=1778678 RepID=A0A6B8RLQ7_9BACL|nr:GntR family transcriptional regulator [Paenibacillus psychroresistens]QGQ96777.1 GntR family transcriptional regulator [Paenibacillus psychroresistens]